MAPVHLCKDLAGFLSQGVRLEGEGGNQVLGLSFLLGDTLGQVESWKIKGTFEDMKTQTCS